MKPVNFSKAALAALLLPLAAPAMALEVQPGDYAWAGDGRTLAIAYFQHQTSDSFYGADGSTIGNSSLDADIVIARMVHYREIAGQKLAFHAILPIGQFDNIRIGGAGQPAKDGIGDLTLGTTWFPVTSAEPTGTTLGLSLFATAPTGVFRNDHVSFGAGTWSLTPQIGMVQGLGNGFFIDASAEMTVTRDFEEAGVSYEREDTTQASLYLRYQWDDATAFSLGYVSRSGGELWVNGAATGQETNNDQLRLVASKMVTPDFQIQGMYGHDIDVKGGFRSEPLAQIRLMKVF
ncbi:transporter [Pseudogemmobacter faecipullorum]|uniref:Transporter n=1 Tax=Pseudogemmobacter faecipullorum TaxID=2755041 RepID=A0ABS8CHT4_9RHOB|nr:transporter [Pseudogemmobacter faecipullorum]MCB5408954.1 transporter [Pseudogemmobacter faecipullorum]